MSVKEEVIEYIDNNSSLFTGLSDQIWDLAETKFEEFKSSDLYCRILEEEGFSVERGIGGLQTAFKGTYGTDEGPSIGFLGEFDALPGLSQQAGVCERKPIVEGGNGHGCGHHIFGAGALAAAFAVKNWLQKSGTPGKVVFYGCPAEEGGSGKAWMVKAGCFKDIDCALTWHPSTVNCVKGPYALASIQATFSFSGLSSHAGSAPEKGRSALDAAELMNIGVQFLREHIPDKARVHYAFLNAGGRTANVVQSDAVLLYQIRSTTMTEAKGIYDRVINIAKGAALMTDTTVEVQFDRACSDLRINHALDRIVYNAFEQIGPVPVTEEDIAFAAQIRRTLPEAALGTDENSLREYYRRSDLADVIHNREIADILFPLEYVIPEKAASTDVGDVSQILPVTQIGTTDFAKDTPLHSWQAVAQGKAPLAHKGMLTTGKVLALAAIDILQNPDKLIPVKDEFARSWEAAPYESPIPEGAQPRLTK
ncbi:MAG: amidohydrolase [Solobacterium sp.]|nr:amidohydrolase [Solobacterium sp.]